MTKFEINFGQIFEFCKNILQKYYFTKILFCNNNNIGVFAFLKMKNDDI